MPERREGRKKGRAEDEKSPLEDNGEGGGAPHAKQVCVWGGSRYQMAGNQNVSVPEKEYDNARGVACKKPPRSHALFPMRSESGAAKRSALKTLARLHHRRLCMRLDPRGSRMHSRMRLPPCLDHRLRLRHR